MLHDPPGSNSADLLQVLQELKDGLMRVGIATRACDFLSVFVCEQHYRLVREDVEQEYFSWVMEV